MIFHILGKMGNRLAITINNKENSPIEVWVKPNVGTNINPPEYHWKIPAEKKKVVDVEGWRNLDTTYNVRVQHMDDNGKWELLENKSYGAQDEYTIPSPDLKKTEDEKPKDNN